VSDSVSQVSQVSFKPYQSGILVMGSVPPLSAKVQKRVFLEHALLFLYNADIQLFTKQQNKANLMGINDLY
jgi:hypothetical protein